MTKTPISTGLREFRVLSTELFGDEDKATLRVKLAAFKSPYDAVKTHQEKGFAKIALDPRGHVYSLQFKGVEVALLVKRHTTLLELGPLETAPALHLKSEEDDWVMVDLLQMSDSSLASTFTKSLTAAQTDAKQLRATLEHLVRENEMKSELINKLENKAADAIDKMKAQAKRYAAEKAAAAAPKPKVVKKKAAAKKVSKVGSGKLKNKK